MDVKLLMRKLSIVWILFFSNFLISCNNGTTSNSQNSTPNTNQLATYFSLLKKTPTQQSSSTSLQSVNGNQQSFITNGVATLS